VAEQDDIVKSQALSDDDANTTTSEGSAQSRQHAGSVDDLGATEKQSSAAHKRPQSLDLTRLDFSDALSLDERLRRVGVSAAVARSGRADGMSIASQRAREIIQDVSISELSLATARKGMGTRNAQHDMVCGSRDKYSECHRPFWGLFHPNRDGSASRTEASQTGKRLSAGSLALLRLNRQRC